MELTLGNVGDMILLAIAPAFLLLSVGSILRVLTNRLARIIDRTRVLEGGKAQPDALQQQEHEELGMLYRRRYAVLRSIALAAGCALLVCLMIVALFIQALLHQRFGQPIAGMFVLAMLCLIGSFGCFLHEIYIAKAWLTLTMQRSLRRRRATPR